MQEPQYLYGDLAAWADYVDCPECLQETEAGYPCEHCNYEIPEGFPDPEEMGELR